jgi:hypothetical protein
MPFLAWVFLKRELWHVIDLSQKIQPTLFAEYYATYSSDDDTNDNDTNDNILLCFEQLRLKQT